MIITNETPLAALTVGQAKEIFGAINLPSDTLVTIAPKPDILGVTELEQMTGYTRPTI